MADESVTCGRQAYPHTETAPPHDWLHVTGRFIGQGLPADGSGCGLPGAAGFCHGGRRLRHVYVAGALDAGAESLNVVNVIFANRSYRILQGELLNVGGEADPGAHAKAMMRLDSPELTGLLVQGMSGGPPRAPMLSRRRSGVGSRSRGRC